MIEHAHALCDCIAELSATLGDLAGGSLTQDQALAKIRGELARTDIMRAMWEVRYFPEDTPPPGVLAGN
jgi:hypothetical protein